MIEILRMQEQHVVAVAALEAQCFTPPWSLQSIRSELDNPLALWLVAADNGNVCGYVGSQTVIDASDVMNIAVDPSYRRRGIASQLLEELQVQLAALGSASLTLEVRESNEAAKALYNSHGFIQVGRRPRYYTNPTEAALILRKEWAL